MSDDPLKPARRALQPAAPRNVQQSSLFEPVNNELIAEARAFTNTLSNSPPVAATSNSIPRMELVRVAVACGAVGGKSFVGIFERHHDRLRLLRNEPLQAEQGSSPQPGLLSGNYVIETSDDWTCPICRSPASRDLWVCHCGEMRGALHCGGAHINGARHCACGRFEHRHLEVADALQIRGASVAAKSPGAARSGAPDGQQQLKQVRYERNR